MVPPARRTLSKSRGRSSSSGFQTGALDAAHDDGLEGLALLDSAADLVDEHAQGRAQRKLVDARPLHAARDLEELRPRALGRARLPVGVGPVAQDPTHVEQGLPGQEQRGHLFVALHVASEGSADDLDATRPRARPAAASASAAAATAAAPSLVVLTHVEDDVAAVGGKGDDERALDDAPGLGAKQVAARCPPPALCRCTRRRRAWLPRQTRREPPSAPRWRGSRSLGRAHLRAGPRRWSPLVPAQPPPQP